MAREGSKTNRTGSWKKWGLGVGVGGVANAQICGGLFCLQFYKDMFGAGECVCVWRGGDEGGGMRGEGGGRKGRAEEEGGGRGQHTVFPLDNDPVVSCVPQRASLELAAKRHRKVLTYVLQYSVTVVFLFDVEMIPWHLVQ